MECSIPILWSSPRPSSRKPTASMQAWESRAMASNGFRSCGAGALGRLLAMYSDIERALKLFPVFTAIFFSETEAVDVDEVLEMGTTKVAKPGRSSLMPPKHKEEWGELKGRYAEPSRWIAPNAQDRRESK